jgi:purine-binding chemotaxis protein CheW
MHMSGSTLTSNASNTTDRQLVTFLLDREEYGVPILSVREINRMMEITTVPHSPRDVLGVINLRGKIIPVVDLRRRFGMGEPTTADLDQRIVVLELETRSVGFVVDSVGEVLRVGADRLDTAPTVATSGGADFVDGIAKLEDRLVIILDPNKLISAKELAKIDTPPALAA